MTRQICFSTVLLLAAGLSSAQQPRVLSGSKAFVARQVAQEPVSAQKGRIKGVVTYFFNENYGDKADTGAEVIVISGTLESIPEDAMVDIYGEMMRYFSKRDIDENNAKSPESRSEPKKVGHFYPVIDRTRVDANGSFELTDLPVGNYTVIIQSKHSSSRPGIWRDSTGRTVCIPVTVKPEHSTDASHSFPAGYVL